MHVALSARELRTSENLNHFIKCRVIICGCIRQIFMNELIVSLNANCNIGEELRMVIKYLLLNRAQSNVNIRSRETLKGVGEIYCAPFNTFPLSWHS